MVPVNPDEPHSVFAAVSQRLAKLERDGVALGRVAVDVTGGKKSMVSNAFLLAAHYNYRITYVDVVEYNDGNSPPTPFSFGCELRQLENPQQLFQVPQWTAVKRLYEERRYDACLDRIGEITKAYEAQRQFLGPLVDLDSVMLPGLKRLCQVLTTLHLWVQGELAKAQQSASSIQFGQTPLAVQELAKLIQPDQSSSSIAALACNDRLLAYYVDDELHRIARLLDLEDYQSVFLRAMVLDEMLLKVRIIRLDAAGWLDISKKTAAGSIVLQTPRPRVELLSRLTRGGLEGLFRGETVTLFHHKKKYVMCARIGDQTITLSQYEVTTPAKTHELRNEAAHWLLLVSADLARVSLETAKHSWAEFCTLLPNGVGWTALGDCRFGGVPRVTYQEPLPWDGLIAFCGLAGLPGLPQ